MGVESQLIPFRFLLTTGHLVVVIMLYSYMEENIYASLAADPTDEEYSDKERSITLAWGLSLLCFALDYYGMFGGYSIFYNSVNLFQIIAHFAGGCYVAMFARFRWHIDYFWYIWIFCNLFPAIMEIGVLLLQFVFKVHRY